MATYKLTFYNESYNEGTFCIYQRDPQQETKRNLFSLAWFTRVSRPNTMVTFTWGLDYCFTWSETGLLKPGVTFEAGQTVAADPVDRSRHQAICLNKNSHGYAFVETVQKAPEGAMSVFTDGSIPHGEASVGLGMANLPTFAYAATPNFSYTFLPHPEYWVTFGDFLPGQVLDVNIVSNTSNVAFENGVYAKTVTLSPQNTWQIASSDA